MDKVGTAIMAIVFSLVGLAGLAIALSSNSDTSSLISTGTAGLTNLLTAIMSPITKSSSSII